MFLQQDSLTQDKAVKVALLAISLRFTLNLKFIPFQNLFLPHWSKVTSQVQLALTHAPPLTHTHTEREKEVDIKEQL